MVNNVNENIELIRTHFIEFENVLNLAKESVSNKNDINDYICYFNSCKEGFQRYTDNINQENALHLHGIIGGLSRYFSEFNWFDDYQFYEKAQDYLNKLTEEKILIYNHYNQSSII